MLSTTAMPRPCPLYGLSSCARVLGRFAGAMLMLLLALPALALDRDRTIAQFHHTTWTAQDGAPADVWAVAQTRDGWLWFGAPTGLYRFDGVHFEHVDLKQTSAGRSEGVSALQSTDSGELLVGFHRGGISVLRNGVFHHERGDPAFAAATVFSMARDADGNLWVGARDRLLRFDGRHWERVGADWNFPGGMAWSVFASRDGTVWVSAGGRILSLSRGAHQFESRLKIGSPAAFMEAPDGLVWAVTLDGSLRALPGVSVRAIQACTANSKNSFIALFDRDGAFWTTTRKGIARIAVPERLRHPSLLGSYERVASASDAYALPGAKSLMEDCEGNIWVPTKEGLNRSKSSAREASIFRNDIE